MAERPGIYRRGLVEFVVIVIGVLVALGLESWWQGQQERELEREYLESLRDEASRGIGVIASVADVSELKRRWLTRANTIFEGALVADSSALFLEGILQGSGISVVPQLTDAVFQDLLNTGRLALIRDDAVRRAIMRGYANVEAMFERRARADANIASGLHALASRHAPVGAIEQLGPRLMVTDDPRFQTEIRRAALELAADPALPGEIRAAYRALDHERNVLTQLDLALADQLVMLEGGELPDRGNFRDFIRADAEAFNTSGSSDSAGTR